MTVVDQTQKSARLSGMSVLAPTANVVGPLRHVQKVPVADSCNAAAGPLWRRMIEDISRRKLFHFNFNKLEWTITYVFDAALFDSRRHEIVIA
jgi:hypothetical protein